MPLDRRCSYWRCAARPSHQASHIFRNAVRQVGVEAELLDSSPQGSRRNLVRNESSVTFFMLLMRWEGDVLLGSLANRTLYDLLQSILSLGYLRISHDIDAKCKTERL